MTYTRHYLADGSRILASQEDGKQVLLVQHPYISDTGAMRFIEGQEFNPTDIGFEDFNDLWDEATLPDNGLSVSIEIDESVRLTDGEERIVLNMGESPLSFSQSGDVSQMEYYDEQGKEMSGTLELSAEHFEVIWDNARDATPEEEFGYYRGHYARWSQVFTTGVDVIEA